MGRISLVAANVFRGILSKRALYVWAAAIVLMLLRSGPAIFFKEQNPQLAAFLQSYGENVIDPDGSGPMFEVPIADHGELWCLHYPEPQTGTGAYPPPASGSCGPVRY